MGLAASQARLLTITARKADCEFQSMSLSHQKLALARDMECVSDEYQNALNVTKLVYDYNGTGVSDMNLTYNLLMTPSMYNNYYPKLVTDPQNKVILNSKYAAAAQAAGIPPEGLLTTPSSDVRNAFVAALADQNIMTPKTAAVIQSITYCNSIGNGSSISTTAYYEEIDYTEFLTRLSNTEDYYSAGVRLGTDDAIKPLNDHDQYLKCLKGSDPGQKTGSGANFNITDLFGDEQWILSYGTTFGKGTAKRNPEEEVTYPMSSIGCLQNALVGAPSEQNVSCTKSEAANNTSLLTWIYDSFASVVGESEALDWAYDNIYESLTKGGTDVQDSTNLATTPGKKDKGSVHGNDALMYQYCSDWKSYWTRKTHSYDSSIDDMAKNNLGICAGSVEKKGKSAVSTSIDQVAKAFLTAYVDFLTGLQGTYKYENGRNNKYVTEDTLKDMKFLVPISYEIDEDAQLYANFYDAMFNMICLNGWTVNDNVDDKEYLAELFKNGHGFISSIDDGGYYNQAAYSTDPMICEVTDTDAVARAEAKYNAEKAKIENKENSIDMKMKNIDSEISALTTEYDTTKNLVSKAVEKSFKRYDA